MGTTDALSVNFRRAIRWVNIRLAAVLAICSVCATLHLWLWAWFVLALVVAQQVITGIVVIAYAVMSMPSTVGTIVQLREENTELKRREADRQRVELLRSYGK